jgi:hypothetical protein
MPNTPFVYIRTLENLDAFFGSKGIEIREVAALNTQGACSIEK